MIVLAATNPGRPAMPTVEIARRRGFRDALLAGFASAMRRCANAHAADIGSRTDCKPNWIRAVEAGVTT